MTKMISIFIVVLVLFGGWHLFLYWEKVKNQEETAKKDAAAAVVLGDQLQGMPPGLDQSLVAAQRGGATGLRNWLKAYGAKVQDPRKAWIELDLCVAIRRDSPAEAREIFARVKKRVAPPSPVFPRMKDLERAFQ